MLSYAVLSVYMFCQYRMHVTLSEFPSNMFNEGSLQNDETEDDQKLLNLPGRSLLV
jgi:superfamily I DNA and/or RNA helicase